jgi:hypothetical protein
LDERIWNRDRDRVCADLVAHGAYATELADLPKPPIRGDRPSHLVVVPMDGPDNGSWKVAGGNFFWEIAQAAREYAGDSKVSVFAVDKSEAPHEWHQRLIRHLVDSGATHVIGQVESDPNVPASWTWDVLWSQLAPRWDGVMLGVVFDSAFQWVTNHTRRIARIDPRFLLVDICMPMDGVMVRRRPEVGPVNMPVSNASLAAIDEYTAGLEKAYDVSFIGTLYPYRVEMIESMRARGVKVAVNPHRTDVTHDFAESRANQPTYKDYMAGLFQSQMTINLAQSSAGNFQQLKTRVLEAAAMGCLVLTDDIDRTDRFWIPGEEYGYFATLKDVPALVESYLNDPEQLARAQGAGRERARAINVTSFWGGIEDGLRRRGLPGILD